MKPFDSLCSRVLGRKGLASRVLATTLAFTFLPAALPANFPLAGITSAEAQSFHDRRFYRQHDGNRFNGRPGFQRNREFYRDRGFNGNRGFYRDRGHYRDGYYRRNNNGAAIAGAIVGLGIGAAIANSNRPRAVYRGGVHRPGTSDWYNYCSARYRSFDPRSGTYQPNNGPRVPCR